MSTGNVIADAIMAAGSQSADKVTRSNAEEYLSQNLSNKPSETLAELLRLGLGSGAPVLSLDLQLLALIRAKRFFVDELGPENARMAIPANVLKQLQQIVLPSLPSLETRRRRQMIEIVALLQQTGWPELIPALIVVLQEPVTPESKSRHQAALEAMYKATREYKSFGGKKHSDFQGTATQVLPLLPALFAHQDVDVARLCLKIFECFTARTTPDLLNTNSNLFDSWMRFLLDFPSTFGAIAQSGDADDDNYLTYTKCIKRIGSISITLMQEARAKKSGVKRMSRYFSKTYSVSFGNFWISWLRFVKDRDSTVHYKPTRFALSFIAEAVDNQRVYEGALKPVAAELITELLFRPYIPFNAEDQQLFDSDPGQFLVENNFDGAKELSLRGMSTRCIKKIVAAKKDFQDKNLLSGLLQYLGTGMQEADGPITDGCFELLMSLKASISAVPTLWNGTMETVIGQYVVPRLSSPHAFIRAKAVQLVGRFNKVPYSTEDIYATVIRAVLQCAQDSNIVVCVSSFSALNTFLISSRAKPYVKPLLGPITKEIVRLLPQTHSELLVVSLRLLIEKFSPELRSLMPEVVASIVQHCLATHFALQTGLATGEDEDGEIDSKALFAIDSQALTMITSIKTLESIFEQVQYDHELVVTLQKEVARLVTEVIRDEDQLDMISEMGSMVRVMVFAGGTSVAPEMWPILKQVFVLVNSNFDMFEEYSGVIDNFLSAAPATFLADEENVQSLVQVYRAVLGARLDVSAEVAAQAPQLLSSAFQHFKTHHAAFDAAAATVLNITLQTLMAAEDIPLKVMLCNVVMDALYYNPNYVIGLMQHSNALPHFLSNYFPFFESLKKDDRSYDQLERKVQVLGVLTLLYNNVIDEATLPSALSVLHSCVTRNGQCYEAFLNDTHGRDPTADDDSDFGSDDSFDEDLEDMDFDENAMVEDDDMDALETRGHQVEGESLHAKAHGPLNDMCSEVDTPINDICEVELTLQWLQQLQANSPALYQTHCSAVPIASYQQAKKLSRDAHDRINQLKATMQQHYLHRVQAQQAIAQ